MFPTRHRCALFLMSLFILVAAHAGPNPLPITTELAPQVPAVLAEGGTPSTDSTIYAIVDSGPVLEEVACSPCPNRCWRDRDCDSFCGGKGLGACVQINSCCRSCSCYGFSAAR
jgi:hypothetical protein